MRGAAAHQIPNPVTGGISVRTLEGKDAARWDGFVEQCPEATFFHRAGWKTVIERSFGHRGYFLYAERDGQVQGILPLGHVKSRLFGNALISTPFCVYGGTAAIDEEAREALEKAAEKLAAALGVDYLELRNQSLRRPDWPTKMLYVTFRKPIDPEPEKNLLEIPRKQRAMVRKGIQAGLVSVLDDDVGRFHQIYSTSVRNLGTPVFSRNYFKVLQEVFGRDCEILTVEKDGYAISSVMSFYFRDQVLPYYGGGLPEARDLKGYDFMYWELMRRACMKGVRMFDYGRSKKDTGSYSFKKNWGFEPEQLHYQYRLVRAHEMPDLNPLNPKYRLFVDLWKRMPLPVANFVGPFLARSLG